MEVKDNPPKLLKLTKFPNAPEAPLEPCEVCTILGHRGIQHPTGQPR